MRIATRLSDRAGLISRGTSACFLLVLLALCFAAPTESAAAFDSADLQKGSEPFKLLRITPSGENVPPGNQVVFEFNRPVVPLGRMERDAAEIPIKIEPKLDCQWRWLNPSTLSCQLDEKKKLVPSTRYRIQISPVITTQDGVRLGEAISHTFVTELPKVSSTWFKTWVSAGGPRLGIRFNQPVDETTVARHLFFSTQKGLRVPANLEVDPDSHGQDDLREGAVWLVGPREELPPGESVSLRVEPGVRSRLGPESSTEKRVLLSFFTFPEFRFLGLECETNAGKTVLISPGQPPSAQPRCNPLGECSMKFSAPVFMEGFKDAAKLTPRISLPRHEDEPDGGFSSYSRLSELRDKDTTYSVVFPWRAVRPFTEYHLQIPIGALKDEFGRPLSEAVDLRFATDHRLPDYYLLKEMPVLEKDLDTDAALMATNIAQMKLDYRVTTSKGPKASQRRVLTIPKIQDSPQPVPLSIRELIGQPSGFVQGQLTPQPPIADKSPSEGWFFAQVTPFHVHTKIGYHNTLVWVTDLKTGNPVPGVQVQVLKGRFEELAGRANVLSQGVTNGDGALQLQGLSSLDPEIKALHAYEPEAPRLFVRCQKGDDIAVMPLNYDFQVASEGANMEYIPEWLRPLHGHVRAWGATAQGIYKVGDTVQYKIYVRDQGIRKFTVAPQLEYQLKVFDSTDKVVHQREGVELSSFGAFDGEFAIPKNGAVGWYRFQLTASFTDEQWEPMRVLVSDFTPSPFKVTTELEGKIFGIGEPVKVLSAARLHAGGPYANADIRLTAVVESRPFSSPNPKAQGFEFDVVEEQDDVEPPESITVFETDGKLDGNGTLETMFNLSEAPVLYGSLTVESGVRDERGKTVANRSVAIYAGRDRYVGLYQGDWLLQEKTAGKAMVLVVDREGSPVPGVPVRIHLERKETRASRVKGAGDAYLTQYDHEWVQESSFDLTSTEEPVEFELTPQRSGSYRIVAAIRDTRDRPQKTTLQRWVTGGSFVLWESIPGNVLDVYPEKKEYKVGETARFMVQNPFPGAKALVTVERFGVLQSWVKTLQSSTEVVEVPVDADYVPGFYLSVLVMSPRVERPAENDTEDLGKPAFRLGYATIEIKDPYKEIVVSAQPDKETYKPRDTVTVDIEAHPANLPPGETRQPIELAVAVLDDAVFDLLRQGRSAYDPYQGFYSLDSLDLANYNLLMQLVGRQKLEKKGADPAGDGGGDLGLRSVFKFLSYWNPSIPVDKEGRAKIQFQVPDSLTGWRILAMAVTPEDRMGLGEKVFRVNQPTEIRPVLPNQVLEGDSFEAGFSVMNRTDAARSVDVQIQVRGAVEQVGDAPTPTLTSQVTLEPFKRAIVRIPLKAGAAGQIVLTARAGDEKDRDAIEVSVPVRERQSLEVAAAYGTTVAGEAVEKIAFPENMRSDAGKVSITASPSVMGNIEGAFRYMRDYPYICWEQRITRAVMAAFFQKLKGYVGSDFSWSDSDGIPAKTLMLAMEHQAPNGGMTYYVPKEEYVDPYLSAYTALAFSWLQELGYSIPREVEERLHGYLQGILKKEVKAESYTRGMTSTVRAVALAVLAKQGKLTQADVERFHSHAPEMSLFGRAHYLQALSRFKGTGKLQETVLKSILAHANQTGGTYVLSETLDTRYRQILASPLRGNCAVLSTLLLLERINPARRLGDIPVRLARTIVESRKARNHWDSTQDNVFALKALLDFSRAYEKEPVNLRVRGWLDSESLGELIFKSPTDASRTLERNLTPADVGRKTTVRIAREGDGRLYYGVNLFYAPAKLKKDPINAGLEVHREYSVERDGRWIILESPMGIRTGELVRVDLYLNVPAERYFVVVNDPVPGGLEPVSRDLATASTVDAEKAEMRRPEGSYLNRFQEWIGFGVSRWSFYHRELRHDGARFYSELLSPGRYHLSYVAQAIAPGDFTVLPTHAEEMYNPDVYGKGIPGVLRVQSSE